MNLCYLYNEKITFPYAKKLIESFENGEKIDISKEKCSKEYGIYIVECTNLTKEFISSVRLFFKTKSNALIYFTVVGAGSTNLYQLAYLLKVRSIITPKQDIAKVLNLIKSAYNTQLHDNKSLYVGRFVADKQCYMIFKEQKLIYASDSLFESFQLKTLKEIEEKVCSKLDINKLLSHQATAFEAKSIFESGKIDVIKSIYRNGEYLLLLDRFDSKDLQCEMQDYLATRLKLIDFLKEKFQERTLDQYSILSIKINNFKKIGNIVGKTELESFLEKFLLKSKELLSKYIIFAEYNQDFYIALYKGTDIEHLEQRAQEYYNEMSQFVQQFNFKVDIAVYVLQLENMELGVALSLLDSIRANKLSKRDIKEKKIKYIGRYHENMSDKEIINLLLDSSYINDTDLKLINVYKGMVVDSPTKILKKDHNAIYVTVKQVQGAVMSLEREVILQSSSFDKDIKAKVAYVDKKRHIAKLENFKIVEDNSFYRDNCRVNFAKKRMAILAFKGTKVSAEILDISATSISLQLGKIKALDKLMNEKIGITFSIPTNRTREGEIKINDTVTVNYIDCTQKDACRIVCNFDETSKYKNIIIEYVHNRQVEIVEELKRMEY